VHQAQEEHLEDGIMCQVGTLVLWAFRDLERIGPVSYRLARLQIMKFHDVFHVSLLKIYVRDVDHAID